ncbi:PaaI family thioesterase [Xylophilus sp. ASV27]|uniref:PaaI family thioesterase n=1 Tax=Xylophilus sp. ASV27 TaxID=2795129 RepID=UPI0018EB417C|nr:PaaI family thioesterase [Xylophilus sp. ASV27]
MSLQNDYIERWTRGRIPFAHHLGFTLERIGEGESELHYTARPEHLNAHGVTHGGAAMTLMDVAMAAAARSVDFEMGVVTIEMKTSFLRPASGPLAARGRLLHRTGSMAFVEARILDESGALCAHATGTFKYVKRRVPAGAGDGISTD